MKYDETTSKLCRGMKISQEFPARIALWRTILHSLDENRRLRFQSTDWLGVINHAIVMMDKEKKSAYYWQLLTSGKNIKHWKKNEMETYFTEYNVCDICKTDIVNLFAR